MRHRTLTMRPRKIGPLSAQPVAAAVAIASRERAHYREMSGRGPVGNLKAVLFGVALLFLLNSCTAVVGAGAAAALIGIAALTHSCYDYVDVTVLDSTGRKTCAATVTATNGKHQLELQSCYYSPLTDGTWTLRATQPGARDAVTTLVVEHRRDCTRSVQSVELTLRSASEPTSSVLLRPPPPSPPPPGTADPTSAAPTDIPPSAAPTETPPSAGPAEAAPVDGGPK